MQTHIRTITRTIKAPWRSKQCFIFAVFRSPQALHTHRLNFSTGSWYLWQLGKGQYGDRGPRTSLYKPACLAVLLVRAHKASASQSVVSQPQAEEVKAAATGAAVVWEVCVGRGVSPAQMLCLNWTNCRLRAGQGWGTTDTLNIVHTG